MGPPMTPHNTPHHPPKKAHHQPHHLPASPPPLMRPKTPENIDCITDAHHPYQHHASVCVLKHTADATDAQIPKNYDNFVQMNKPVSWLVGAR